MKLDAKHIAQNHGITKGGTVQKRIDAEVIRRMKPYTPARNMVLSRSARKDTVIGSGEIRQNTPYAHYQYMGVVYGPNFPQYDQTGEISGRKSPRKKYPTSRELVYSTARHAKAGKRWFHRMKADHRKKILAAAQKLIDRGVT